MRSIFIFAVIISTTLFANAQSLGALDLFNRGVEASTKGDDRAALAHFTEVRTAIEREGASDRFFVKVLFNIGVSLYRLQRPAEAVPELERALRYANQFHAQAQYVLGRAQFDLGNLSSAERSLRRSIALSADDAEAWYDLAFVYLAEKRSDDAKKAFAKAAKLGAAGFAASLNNVGVLLAIEGKLADAALEFEKAAHADTTGIALANLEKCRHFMDNFPVAVATEFGLAGRRNV